MMRSQEGWPDKRGTAMSLRIVVQVNRSDDQRVLANITRRLSADLRSRGIGAEPETSDAPAGSKGAVTDVGVLVVTSLLSAGSINALARVLVARVRAGTTKSLFGNPVRGLIAAPMGRRVRVGGAVGGLRVDGCGGCWRPTIPYFG